MRRRRRRWVRAGTTRGMHERFGVHSPCAPSTVPPIGGQGYRMGGEHGRRGPSPRARGGGRAGGWGRGGGRGRVGGGGGERRGPARGLRESLPTMYFAATQRPS